jgi:thiamine-phosphate pyrophosphorylase
MQKKLPKIYCFVYEFNLSELSKLGRDISVIYRNYNNIDHLDNILKLKKFCKKSKNEFYLSNNFKLAVRLGLSGVYIPSFNKKINYGGAYSLPKYFKIIGSAHNPSEIIIKQKQNCHKVFLSPIFKVNKSKHFLGVSKFNLIALTSQIDCIALGGINQKNFKKIKLLRSKGFASTSWAKKNGLKKLGRFKI